MLCANKKLGNFAELKYFLEYYDANSDNTLGLCRFFTFHVLRQTIAGGGRASAGLRNRMCQMLSFLLGSSPTTTKIIDQILLLMIGAKKK